MTSLRGALLAFSLTLLALAHVLLGGGLWLGIGDDAFAFLQPLACLLPIFCTLNFQHYFGIAFMLAAIGCLGLILAAGRTLSMPAGRDLDPLPGPLRFGTRFSRIGFRVLLALVVLAAAGFAIVALTPPGNPPPLLWLAVLALAAVTFGWADRAARRRAFFSPRELLLLGGYVTFLLVLAFAFREPFLRAIAMVAVLAAALWLWRARPGAREPVAFALIVMAALAVYSFDLMSWRYAFIGDEYAFFDFANNIINAASRPYLLSPMGAYDVHPVFATYVQVATITLFGNDIYGWRISESLAVMLAALPLYVILRTWVSREAALLALVVFLASQHLLGITKVGYTYSQLFVPLLGGLALMLLALRRRSLLGFFLSGCAAAFAFYTFAFGIPFIVLPVMLFGLSCAAPRVPSANPQGGPQPPFRLRLAQWLQPVIFPAAALIVGIGLTAMPSLSDPRALERIAGHTVAHSEVRGGNNLTDQVIPNFLYTLTASLSFQGHSHYVDAAHLDPLSSLLLLIGAAVLIVSARRSRVALWLLAAFLLVCLFTGGFAPYPYPPIARTYILIPFYALFAAFGISQLFAWLRSSRAARFALPIWIILMLAIPALNFYQFFVLTDRHNPQERVAMVVREFQTRPSDQIVYVVERPSFNFSAARMVLRAYHLNPDRMRAITNEYGDGSLGAMLRSGADEVLVDWDSALRDRWRSTFRTQWPDQSENIIADGAGVRHYVRLAFSGPRPDLPVRGTPPSAQTGAPFIVTDGTSPQLLNAWRADQPRDIAIARDGTVYLINGKQQSIEVHASDGAYLRTLPGAWQEPFALAFNSSQELVVLDSGARSVSLIGTDGTLLARSDPDAGLNAPRGLAIDAFDGVYVADTGNGRIVHFNPVLLSPEVWPTGAPLQQPAGIMLVGQSVVVADAPSMYVLSSGGAVLAQWQITGYNTVEPPHMLPYQTSLIVMTDPEAGAIVVYDLKGHRLVNTGPPAYERLLKPLGIAAQSDGRVYVSEYEGNRVHVFDWTGP